jgi:6-phosphogluconate dehydrogenase
MPSNDTMGMIGGMNSCNIGVIGLATMGRNLALNLLDQGLKVAAWNLEAELIEEFRASCADPELMCCSNLRDFVAALERPRRILMMIKAGNPVDQVLETLQPLLSPGDIVIDGGNTQFQDTRRRHQQLAQHQIEFVGMGVSGGEYGARHGPSLMVGGSDTAWRSLQPELEAIAASSTWGPCAKHMGPDGAGHFVKMVHNGIEYGDMQLIAEIYDLMSRGDGQHAQAISATFSQFNTGPLQSYLVELTAQVLEKTDDITQQPLVDMIHDAAEQKGTGRWTIQAALDLGVPVPTIAAAVDARAISSMYQQRQEMCRQLPTVPPGSQSGSLSTRTMGQAMLAAKICAYAQGLQLIRAGSDAYQWHVALSLAARVWTGGCIIRARLLDDIIEAFLEQPTLDNLLLHPRFTETMAVGLPALRELVQTATAAGIPIPAFSASLAWYDAIRSARLPQNLTQAQRDAFGAHTYRRRDDPTPVHSDWFT